MSEYNSTTDTGSFSSINRKTRLIDTGTNIEAATKQGAGQEAFCTSSSAGKLIGYNYELVSTTNYQPKLASLFNSVKFGVLTPSDSSVDDSATGLLNAATVLGTIGVAALDTTEGLANTFTSGASAGNQAGLNRALLYTTRAFNPSFKLRWKIDEAGANIRFFAGWTSSTAAIGNSDDPLNAISGFGIAISTAQANYRIFSNDGAGATVSADTSIAKDTAYHTIELWADDNGTRFWWSLDGSTPVAVTADIPASTTSLSCQFAATAVNADAKVMSVIKSVITSDK